MAKIKRFFHSHRIFFGLFLFMLVYETAMGSRFAPWQVSEHFYNFYAVDYGLGFCSRFLPGAVYRLFFPQVEGPVLTAVTAALLILFLTGLCLLLERLLLRTPDADRSLCLFFVLLYITGPGSFVLFSQWLGVIDFYWMLPCIAFMAALAYRRLRPLIPLLFVLMVLVHYGALLSYVPMMAVLLLYRMCIAQEKKERRSFGAVLVIGVCAAVALTGYFILFERKNVTLSMEEFNAVLLSRGAKYTYYYDYNIFRNLSSEGDMSAEAYIYGGGSALQTLVRSVWMQLRTTIALHVKAGWSLDYVLALLALCPVAVLVSAVLFSRMRDPGTVGFFKKAVYALPPLLFVFCFIASTLFSSDRFRWLSNSFLPLLTVFLYMAYCEKDAFWKAARKKTSVLPAASLIVFLMLYAGVVLAE